MANFIERLFNAPVEEVPDPNDVEVYQEQVYEGFSPVPELETTQDVLPAVVMLPEVVNTSMAVARHMTFSHHVMPNRGDIRQLGNYNKFRRRYIFRPWTNNIWICASLEDAQNIANNPLNLENPVNALLPSNGMFMETTAPLWAVTVTAGATGNYMQVAQEFYDG